MSLRGRIASIMLVWLATAAPAGAHPISVTDAFVHVAPKHVTANLEVFVEDLFLFHGLQPNELDFLEPEAIERGIVVHEAFLLERFLIRDARGEALAGKCREIKRFPMDARGVPLAESMAYKLTFVFEYDLDAPPEFLTFSQHLLDEQRMVPAEILLRVKQESGGVAFEQLLYPDNPQTVRFDWDRPPLSADASQEQWQQWYQQQKQQTLGITSYSSVYSFLYLDNFEIRHEILIPLLTLQESVRIERAADAFLEVAEQQAASGAIEAFFTSGNPLEIDGVTVQPVVQRLDFYGLDFKDFAQRAERQRVSMANARVGIILSYSTKGTPSTVRLTWDRFNRFLWTVNMIVYAYEDTQTVRLSRIGRQNTFEWQNPGRPAIPPLEQVDVNLPPRPRLSLPLISLGCVALLPAMVLGLRRSAAATRFRGPVILLLVGGAVAAWPFARWSLPHPLAAAPQPSREQAAAIFAALHKNAYRAFDYRDEQQVYDALAKSVEGPLLRTLYLQVRRGLEMQEQGGAVARVREVKIVQGRRLPQSELPAESDDRGFAYQCRWTVAGTVEHWGHIHERTNEYEARFRVERRAGIWKITGLDVQNQRRLSFQTKLRGL